MLLLAYDTTNIARQHFSPAEPLARHDGCILRVVGRFVTLPPQRITNRSLRLQLNAYLFGVHIARRMVEEQISMCVGTACLAFKGAWARTLSVPHVTAGIGAVAIGRWSRMRVPRSCSVEWPWFATSSATRGAFAKSVIGATSSNAFRVIGFDCHRPR